MPILPLTFRLPDDIPLELTRAWRPRKYTPAEDLADLREKELRSFECIDYTQREVAKRIPKQTPLDLTAANVEKAYKELVGTRPEAQPPKLTTANDFKPGDEEQFELASKPHLYLERGDVVECVDSAGTPLTKGGIYTVTGRIDSNLIVNDTRPSWRAFRFRSVARGREGWIAHESRTSPREAPKVDGVIMEVMLRDGTILPYSDTLRWGPSPDGRGIVDIVAYRLE